MNKVAYLLICRTYFMQTQKIDGNCRYQIHNQVALPNFSGK